MSYQHTAGAAVLEPPQQDSEMTTASDIPPLTITPASYAQLRMLAECAAGLGEQVSRVFAISDGTLQILESTEGVADTEVLVGAYDGGKFPEVVTASFSVAWSPSEDMPPATGTVNAVDYGADAMFWSDSAVKKFVFPHFASCAGDQAWSALKQLQDAWNSYPGNVGMYTLMHLRPAMGQDLTLQSQFALTYVEWDAEQEAGAVNVTTLQQYAIAPGAPRIGGGTQAGFRQAQPTGPYPAYVELRGMAEWAESLSTAPEWFVLNGNQAVGAPATTMPPLQPGQVMVPAFTPSVPAVRPAAGGVSLQLKGHDPRSLANADAAFWSSGSIQQFLLPYYASVRGFKAPQELTDIIRAWELNIPKKLDTNGSTESLSGVEGEASTAEEGTETAYVYGLVHLPQSAWVTVDEMVAALQPDLTPKQQETLTHHYPPTADPYSAHRRVGVVYHDEGGHHVLTLHDFKVLYHHHFR